MRRSHLRCGFVTSSPVYVDGPHDGAILLGSSSCGVAVVPADVQALADDDEVNGDATVGDDANEEQSLTREGVFGARGTTPKALQMTLVKAMSLGVITTKRLKLMLPLSLR